MDSFKNYKLVTLICLTLSVIHYSSTQVTQPPMTLEEITADVCLGPLPLLAPLPNGNQFSANLRCPVVNGQCFNQTEICDGNPLCNNMSISESADEGRNGNLNAIDCKHL